MPKIKVEMSPKSLQRTIDSLRQYKASVERKTELLRKRVAEVLKELVETGFNGNIYNDIIHQGMRAPNVDVILNNEREGVSVVIADGEEAVFAEFGAGVYYNGPVGSFPHPNRPAGIVAIGTYGKGYGSRQIWGYYDSETGELRLTHGTPASMPMYHAVQEIAKRLPEIAREVFRKGEGTDD